MKHPSSAQGCCSRLRLLGRRVVSAAVLLAAFALRGGQSGSPPAAVAQDQPPASSQATEGRVDDATRDRFWYAVVTLQITSTYSSTTSWTYLVKPPESDAKDGSSSSGPERFSATGRWKFVDGGAKNTNDRTIPGVESCH